MIRIIRTVWVTVCVAVFTLFVGLAGLCLLAANGKFEEFEKFFNQVGDFLDS